MIDVNEIIRRLAGGAEGIRALVQDVPAQQAMWSPGPETWSLHQTLEHLYNEERIDFRKHLMEMLSRPPRPWQTFDPAALVKTASCQEALQGFLTEREASLKWLKGLESSDWNQSAQAPWGAIRAGDVLASWAAHDYLHLRQINELLFAWNARQSAPYSVEYAGEW